MRDQLDAVIVAYADRWSRDNAKSKEGLDAFRKHNVRFFVGTMEMDLFDPQSKFILGMHAEVGEFIAGQQAKKSLEVRIERAKRGVPTCGKLPFGRRYDEAAEQWVIDPEGKAMVEDVARRYLKGEPMAKLAAEHGVNHANLHKILTRRCGDKWQQEFTSKTLNIHEVVETTVPPLLPEETIRAIRERAEQNKTFRREQKKHQYLLGRLVFCSHCGYAMTSQTNNNGHRYYRHAARNECTVPGTKAWVNAEHLEDAVVYQLFDLFGNPAAIRRAVEEARPAINRAAECQERARRIRRELEEVSTARARIIRFIVKGTITEAQVEKEMRDLMEREKPLSEELARLTAEVENAPTAEEIATAAEQAVEAFADFIPSAKEWAKRMTREHVNIDLKEMTWEDKRSLLEMVFCGKTSDRKRMGIYLRWCEGQQQKRQKRWNFRIQGHLINQGGIVPREPAEFDPEDGEFAGGPLQDDLLQVVSQSSSC